jgi:hypothetical protein
MALANQRSRPDLRSESLAFAFAALLMGSMVLASPDEADPLASPQTRLTPPHADRGLDTDGDGQFDFLAVDVNLSVHEAGEYFLHGRLRDAGNASLTSASESPQLDPGAHTIRLRFDGVAINASGIDGPYEVDLSFERMDERLDTGGHVTGPYDHATFESPFAEFTPPHSEEAVDADGDGLYEVLVVDATVTVETAGRYVSRAWAHDRDGALRVIVDRTFDLGLGMQTLRFSFEGAKINASGVDGPYTVDLWIFTPDYRHSDFDTLQTAPYRASDFGGPPSGPGAVLPPEVQPAMPSAHEHPTHVGAQLALSVPSAGNRLRAL